MEGLVLDAAVALTLCYPDEQSNYADAVVDYLAKAEAFVPALWATEISNGIVIGERRGRLTRAESTAFISLLGDLSVIFDPKSGQVAFTDVLELARTHQ